MKNQNDHTRSIEEAAQELGVGPGRLERIMEDMEWLFRGDGQSTVVEGQIKGGNLVKKNGIRVTPQGMDALRQHVRPPPVDEEISVTSGVHSDDDIPY